jgi:hypothetical protein
MEIKVANEFKDLIADRFGEAGRFRFNLLWTLAVSIRVNDSDKNRRPRPANFVVHNSLSVGNELAGARSCHCYEIPGRQRQGLSKKPKESGSLWYSTEARRMRWR